MHTYATVRDFQDWLRDQGSSVLDGANDKAILDGLESASRNIVSWCERNRDFGPVVGVRKYAGDGRSALLLRDDLISLDSVSVGGSEVDPDAIELVSETGTPPYRKLILPSPTRAAIVVSGTWGYSDDRVDSGATVGAVGDEYDVPLGEASTSIEVSDPTKLAPGHTLRIDDEQLYVKAVGETLTVDRGVNGTTAAEHAYGSTIEVYRYPSDLTEATCAIRHRRWRMREAGLTGEFGGGDMPVVTHRDPEQAILRNLLGNRYRFFLVR
jgi:hypothetical protein